MTFDPDRFVDELAMSLMADVSDEVRNMVFGCDVLAQEIMTFQQEAKDGLRAVRDRIKPPEALEADLRARKSRIVACAPSHAFTLEKIVARASEQVVAKAREVAG